MASGDDIGGVWRTIGGRRVFIRDGESVKSAMEKSGKFKSKTKKEELKQKIENIKKKDEVFYKKKAEEKTKKGKNKYEKDVEKKAEQVKKEKTNELKPFKKEEVDENSVKARGNLTDKEAKECVKLANDLYKDAEKREPQISKDIINSAEKNGGKMYGLDFRLKQPSSLAGKIGADVKEDKTGKTTFKMAADNIKDNIRYTAILDEKDFVKQYNGIKSDLESKGYKENRCKNFYQMYKEDKSCQKAIQCVYEDKDGYKFELQFHTDNSQGAKNLNHIDLKLYDRWREQKTPRQEKMKLYGQMSEIGECVREPNDIYTIKAH